MGCVVVQLICHIWQYSPRLGLIKLGQQENSQDVKKKTGFSFELVEELQTRAGICFCCHNVCWKCTESGDLKRGCTRDQLVKIYSPTVCINGRNRGDIRAKNPVDASNEIPLRYYTPKHFYHHDHMYQIYPPRSLKAYYPMLIDDKNDRVIQPSLCPKVLIWKWCLNH